VNENRKNIAPGHLEPMAHTDSFVGVVDCGRDDCIEFKLPSINGKTVPGFHGKSVLNSVNWLRP
jgi:hypothetical protein